MSRDDPVWMRRPGEGRYAQLECERRFLLSRLPSGMTSCWLIEDRYVTGTRLRLRRFEADEQVCYKFCQKVRSRETDPSHVAVTNIYLSRQEYERLSLLPAHPLRKTRWQWRVGGLVFAVDQFHDDLDGLLLAEVDLADAAADLVAAPPIHAEVTHDERFTGGYLAQATPAEIAELLRLARAG